MKGGAANTDARNPSAREPPTCDTGVRPRAYADRHTASATNLLAIVARAAARSRNRTGGQRPKLTPSQARIARHLHEELDADGVWVHKVDQIATEFGVTHPTIYRHLRTAQANQ
jgi:hypothetical protein